MLKWVLPLVGSFTLATGAWAETTSSALAAKLELTTARQAVENAKRDLDIAQLRYSAARSGQAKKHDNFLISMTNPGSRRRWQKAVDEASAEVERARVELAGAEDQFEKVRSRVCASEPSLSDCHFAP